MKKILLSIFTLPLMATSLSFLPPKLSKPQEEIITQFSEEVRNSSLKIALVMPKKIIGRYSVASIDTMLAYLSARGVDFEFEVFDCEDEEEDSIQRIYQQIQKQDFQFILGIFTKKGAYEASKLPLKVPLYIPTVNASQINFTPSLNPLLFFGGISYKDQIEQLLMLHQSQNPIVAYNDDSPVGERLSSTLKDFFPQIEEQTITNEIAATFNKQAKEQETIIEGADIFLNTPIVKSGLLLSQMGYFKKKASKFLSTQINYNPSIIILTQKRDRANLYIANSIGSTNQKLIEYGSLLNSDLKFDWVNYSTALGLEMFFKVIFPDSLAYFQESIQDNQIQYTTRIYQINSTGFSPVDVKALRETLNVNAEEVQNPQETQENDINQEAIIQTNPQNTQESDMPTPQELNPTSQESNAIHQESTPSVPSFPSVPSNETLETTEETPSTE